VYIGKAEPFHTQNLPPRREEKKYHDSGDIKKTILAQSWRARFSILPSKTPLFSDSPNFAPNELKIQNRSATILVRCL